MRFCFGHFVLDSDARELLRDGEAVHLSPKAYELLEALVENRPKALSKSALHDLLWPNTFVVETNLANLVVGDSRRDRGQTAPASVSPHRLRLRLCLSGPRRRCPAPLVPAAGRVRPGGVHRLIWQSA